MLRKIFKKMCCISVTKNAQTNFSESYKINLQFKKIFGFTSFIQTRRTSRD